MQNSRNEPDDANPNMFGTDSGNGSLVTVCKGYHEVFAIKVIKGGHFFAKLLQNLQSEIDILQSLSHQHITKLINDMLSRVLAMRGRLFNLGAKDELPRGHPPEVPILKIAFFLPGWQRRPMACLVHKIAAGEPLFRAQGYVEDQQLKGVKFADENSLTVGRSQR
ncbi:hypothetical protein HWV62_41320 [Athelia sp. TMB]|nr:hypothetical protein HWV62_18850 [Athelia sp. TMB]KAF7985999.1 hypothetical protein HWV62_41320 [Athelia sp. TMB]